MKHSAVTYFMVGTYVTGEKKAIKIQFFFFTLPWHGLVNTLYSPIDIPSGNRQVEKEDEPVQRHEHQHGDDAVADHLWDHPLRGEDRPSSHLMAMLVLDVRVIWS